MSRSRVAFLFFAPGCNESNVAPAGREGGHTCRHRLRIQLATSLGGSRARRTELCEKEGEIAQWAQNASVASAYALQMNFL